MSKVYFRTQRFSVVMSGVVLDTATPPAAATPIDMRSFAGGAVIVASTIASVTFTWYGCDNETGTYVPIYFGGAAVTTTLPGGTACAVEIPDACWAYPFVKISSNADDGESVTVVAKS